MPGTASQRGTDLLRQRFPAMSGTEARVVVPDPGGDRLDGALLAIVSDRLRVVPGAGAVGPPGLSADGDTALIAVQYTVPVTELGRATATAGRSVLFAGATVLLSLSGLSCRTGGPFDHRPQHAVLHLVVVVDAVARPDHVPTWPAVGADLSPHLFLRLGRRRWRRTSSGYGWSSHLCRVRRLR